MNDNREVNSRTKPNFSPGKESHHSNEPRTSIIAKSLFSLFHTPFKLINNPPMNQISGNR